MTLDQLNALDHQAFTRALGDIFEHSPWVPELAWAARPFASVDALHAALCAVVDAADTAQQLNLIRAHPELAGKAAIRGELTNASTQEQHSAGLDQCSQAEYLELHRLNQAYTEHFGFPFILAVRGHTRDSIIANLSQRIGNPLPVEHAEALRQIGRIAAFRLADRIQTG